MLLIIGGAARTGKGILSRRLLIETHLPFLSLDILKMGLVNGLPTYPLDPEAPADVVARQLWPLAGAMAVNMIETGVAYIVEGEILPEHADMLMRRCPGKVKACFVGYADIAPYQKLAEIRWFGGYPNDWMADYSDEDALALIEQSIAFSRYLREECARYGMAYFDTSENFEGALERIVAYFKTELQSITL